MASATALNLPPQLSVTHVEDTFDPSQPLRKQLSALSECLVEGTLPNGQSFAVGWWPERSPGGAFRVDAAGREVGWADGWAEVRALVQQLVEPA